jgi:hypothetical protein
MKKYLMAVLMVLVMLVGTSYAGQIMLLGPEGAVTVKTDEMLKLEALNAPPKALRVEEPTGWNLGMIAVGQDNAWLWVDGESAFLAVGGGMDFLKYEKDNLAVALHGTIMARVTGDNHDPIFGISANLDVVKLLSGYNINIAIPELAFLIGPVAVYDVWKGKFGGGVMINFNYAF